MNTLIFNTNGDILSIVVPGQDIEAVRSNWADIQTDIVEVDESIQLVGFNRRFLYRVNPETKELINA